MVRVDMGDEDVLCFVQVGFDILVGYADIDHDITDEDSITLTTRCDDGVG